jgi:predicted DNA-binding transcriptional regulator YafY
MSQRQQLERILEIDLQIRAGKYPNADRLASALGVGRRVIFNDREFMLDRLGAPIEYDRSKGGWFYTDQTWTLQNIMVTEGELLAFFLSLEVARRMVGTAFEQPLHSAVEKFTKNIRGPVSIDLETLHDHYSFSSPALSLSNEQTLLDLHRAIRENRRIWMRYFTASRDEHTERTISPYHLYNIQGDWYLIAYDDLRQAFRNFHVGRIEEWHLLSETFQRDPSFSIQDWMSNAFKTERGDDQKEVVIKFDNHEARYIRERCWHETQQIEELPDGGLVLTFKTGGFSEVQRWVMQYGSHAEVLQPVELREKIKQDIKLLEQLYKVE